MYYKEKALYIILDRYLIIVLGNIWLNNQIVIFVSSFILFVIYSTSNYYIFIEAYYVHSIINRKLYSAKDRPI